MVDILEYIGFSDAVGMELVFLLSALVGGTLFFVWFLLVMIGGAAGDIAEGLFDIDFGDSDLSFKSLTFQGILAFFMMFGLVGFAMMRSDQDAMLSGVAGMVAGGVSMLMVAKMFEGFQKLETSGNVDINNAVGSTGHVYARIRPGGIGEVQVSFQGKMQTMEAVSAQDATLNTGDFIKVVGVVGNTLQVERIESGTINEEE